MYTTSKSCFARCNAGLLQLLIISYRFIFSIRPSQMEGFLQKRFGFQCDKNMDGAPHCPEQTSFLVAEQSLLLALLLLLGILEA